MTRPCTPNHRRWRNAVGVGVLGTLALGFAGCSSHSTQRASLEYRPVVLEPNGNRVATGSRSSSGSGSTALTSVPTD